MTDKREDIYLDMPDGTKLRVTMDEKNHIVDINLIMSPLPQITVAQHKEIATALVAMHNAVSDEYERAASIIIAACNAASIAKALYNIPGQRPVVDQLLKSIYEILYTFFENSVDKPN